VGLVYNPAANIRKPAPPQGRNRRLTAEEERKLLQACDAHIRALKACGRKIGRREPKRIRVVQVWRSERLPADEPDQP